MKPRALAATVAALALVAALSACGDTETPEASPTPTETAAAIVTPEPTETATAEAIESEEPQPEDDVAWDELPMSWGTIIPQDIEAGDCATMQQDFDAIADINDANPGEYPAIIDAMTALDEAMSGAGCY